MSNLLKVVIFLAIGSVVAFFILRNFVEPNSPIPSNLGVENGRFAPCPDSPNCVSTQAITELHGIEPIKYDGDTASGGGTAAAQQKILTILEANENITLISQDSTYIHAESQSKLWRFIDDIQFYFDEAESTIHFRSSSRLGYSDMGANRQRMEAIRAEFAASP